jgi:hypothetical protein
MRSETLHPLYFILGFPILVYGTGVWIYSLAQFPFAVVYPTRGLVAYVNGLKYTCIVCYKKESSRKVFRFAIICQVAILVGLLPVIFFVDCIDLNNVQSCSGSVS